MLNTYHHTKTELATAVARNLSRNTNQLVWVLVGGLKSVSSMKFVDTSVVQVCTHSDIPYSTVMTGYTFALFHKGKKRIIH